MLKLRKQNTKISEAEHCEVCESEKGLYNKYIISKSDGSPVNPAAEYFVLRIDNDANARKAAITYAISVMHDNPKLCYDLISRVIEYSIKRDLGSRFLSELLMTFDPDEKGMILRFVLRDE